MRALRIVETMLFRTGIPVTAGGFEIGTFAFAEFVDVHAMLAR